jgi:impB/mucB/samB family C-terminal domain
VTLKVKYANFRQITRSRTGQAPIATRAELEQLGYALLEPLFPVTKGNRLFGVTLSSLGEGQPGREPQLSLSRFDAHRISDRHGQTKAAVIRSAPCLPEQRMLLVPPGPMPAGILSKPAALRTR